MEDYLRSVEEHVKSQDDLEFGLGDTLDVKTSIAVVAITFLATQSAGFLDSKPALPPWLHFAQFFSILFLAVAGVLALGELWPRKYAARTAPGEFQSWVERLSTFYNGDPDSASKVITEIARQEIQKSTKRFEHNSKVNTQKFWFLEWCFRLTLFALMLNLLTLVVLAFGH
ncbi:MAG TPA: hypothetical protein VFL79_08560 [Terriglobia bacterium]|nr:hypothetical protein [Terriglobia bacterium]